MKTDLLAIWTKHLATTALLRKGDRVLLAVSGGLDSVVMAHLFKAAGYDIGLAHCNFQLRGKDADGDEAFVQQLAVDLGVSFFSTRFNTAQVAEERGISIQMAARDLRYDWLEGIRKQYSYYYIATAHHQNDNVETLLLNLSKGTGMAGLHGILPKTGHIIRPLLGFKRTDLERYAEAQQLAWREDQSNAETKYQRNLIRLEVLPLLEQINPAIIDTLAADIERFRQVEQVYQYGLQKLLKKLVEPRRGDEYLSIPRLLHLPAPQTLLFEWLRPHGFNETQAHEAFTALHQPEAKQFFAPNKRLVKDKNWLVVTGLQAEDSQVLLLTLNDLKKPTKLAGFQLKYHLQTATNYHIPQSSQTAAIDMDLLEFPLTLRRWQQGDYFYPVGMNRKKKKLSKYLMGEKLPILERENTWVLLSGEKIVWVIGQRLDERFKITPKTRQVLEVKVGA